MFEANEVRKYLFSISGLNINWEDVSDKRVKMIFNRLLNRIDNWDVSKDSVKETELPYYKRKVEKALYDICNHKPLLGYFN